MQGGSRTVPTRPQNKLYQHLLHLKIYQKMSRRETRDSGRSQKQNSA
jgi:hypothetical protein